MKYMLLQVGVLTMTVVLIVGAARSPVARAWGPAGSAALYAAATICLAGALLAALPLGLTATYWPAYAPHVAFAGTAVRLLSSAGLALGYEAYAQPALSPFLACLAGIYLLLLIAEKGLIVYIVRRAYVQKTAGTP